MACVAIVSFEFTNWKLRTTVSEKNLIIYRRLILLADLKTFWVWYSDILSYLSILIQILGYLLSDEVPLEGEARFRCHWEMPRASMHTRRPFGPYCRREPVEQKTLDNWCLDHHSWKEHHRRGPIGGSEGCFPVAVTINRRRAEGYDPVRAGITSPLIEGRAPTVLACKLTSPMQAIDRPRAAVEWVTVVSNDFNFSLLKVLASLLY